MMTTNAESVSLDSSPPPMLPCRDNGPPSLRCLPLYPAPPTPHNPPPRALQAGTIRGVMMAPLPRVFEDTAVAAGGAVAKGVETIGGDPFMPDVVTRALQEASQKLEADVVAPLQRWQDVHAQLAVSAWRGAGGGVRPGRGGGRWEWNGEGSASEIECVPALVGTLPRRGARAAGARQPAPDGGEPVQKVRARAGEELAAATAAAPAAAATPTAPRLRLPLLSRVDVQRSKLGKKGGSAKREAQLEESIKHLQHKQGKMDGEGHSAQCGEGGTAGGGDREETGRRKGGDREPCRQFVLPADGSAASIFQHRPSSPPPPPLQWPASRLWRRRLGCTAT